MFRMVHVRQHERGLWFRRDKFIDLILPGSTWLLSWQDRIQIVDTTDPRFRHPLLHLITENPSVQSQIEVVRVDEMQRAMVWKDGRLIATLGAGRHVFWKTAAQLQVEIYSIATSARLDDDHSRPMLHN